MIKDIAQVQSAPLTNLRLTHFMGLMTYTRDQWLAAFDADHPAPGKLPAQTNTRKCFGTCSKPMCW